MSHLSKLLDKSEVIRNHTLTKHNLGEIEAYASGFNSWLLDNPTPGPSPIWRNAIFECNVLSEASFFLSVHGFYERASATLRGILDAFLSRVYWDIRFSRSEIKDLEIRGVKSNEYAQWELGRTKKFPGLKKDVIPTIKSHDLIVGYDSGTGLINSCISLLDSLNLFVHGRPTSRHYGGATRSSTINIEFKEKHFLEWYRDLKKIHSLIAQFSILLYPYIISFNVGKTLINSNPSDFSMVKSYIENLEV